MAVVACLVLAAGLLWAPRWRPPASSRPRRVLNAARGISIWEELAEAEPSAPEVAPSLRYAVAYVWSDPQLYYREHNWTIDRQSYVGPYSEGRGVCGLALTAVASRRLLQESVGAAGVAEAVVLTDGIEAEQAAYLRELGIRLIFTNMTELYTWGKFGFTNMTSFTSAFNSYHSNHRAAYFKLRASVMKGALAGLTEYRALIYLDVDAYLYAAPPNANPMEGLEDGRVEMLTARCCFDAPLPVGSFALKPQQDAFEDMMRLVDQGFHPARGWGDQGLRIGPGNWPENHCKPLHDSTRAYCEDPNTTRWDFIGAEGDKGLLFSEYSRIRHTFKQLYHEWYKKRLPAYNFFGKYKPWMYDNPCVDYATAKGSLHNIPEYWEVYQKYARPGLTSLAASSTFGGFCLAELDKGMKSYEQCASGKKSLDEAGPLSFGAAG